MAKRTSSQKGQRDRRAFSAEFKAKVVEMVRQGERFITEICRDLDLTDSAVRNWVRQADGGPGGGGGAALGESEAQELARLRAKVRQLKMERDILKKAAFFVREST